MPQKQPRRLPARLKRFFSTSLFHIIALALTLVVIWYVYAYYRINEIKVITSGKMQSISGLEYYYHSSILLLQAREMEQTLLRLNPRIKSIRMERQFPDTINLYIEYGEMIAQFAADNGYLILNSDAVVLQRQRTSAAKIPTIYYYQRISYGRYQPGSNLELAEVLDALYFLSQANDLGAKVYRVDIKGGHMIRLMLTEDDAVIVVTTEKDRLRQAYEMGQILRRLKVQGQSIKTLDLRFDKPVIVLK